MINIKKEWRFMDKKYRQYRSNQGRSPERMEEKYKATCSIMFIGAVLFIVFSIYYWLK